MEEINNLYLIRSDRELVKKKIKEIIKNTNDNLIKETLSPILRIDYDVNNRMWSQIINIRIKKIEKYFNGNININNMVPKITNKYTNNHDELYKGRRYDDK